MLLKTFLLSLFLMPLSFVFSQQISGSVVSDSASVRHLLVINIDSQDKIYTDDTGQFTLSASVGQKLRFVKEGYERKDILIKNNDYLTVNISKVIIEIPEVEIKKKLSGDLAKDSKLFDENKQKVALNNDLWHYYKAPASLEVLKAKPGDFVQPLSGGFGIGKINNKWVITDLVEWLRKNLTDDYFTSMGLGKAEINSFLYFSLRSFDSRIILKYGLCSDGDVGNLKLHFENSLLQYRTSK